MVTYDDRVLQLLWARSESLTTCTCNNPRHSFPFTPPPHGTSAVFLNCKQVEIVSYGAKRVKSRSGVYTNNPWNKNSCQESKKVKVIVESDSC